MQIQKRIRDAQAEQSPRTPAWQNGPRQPALRQPWDRPEARTGFVYVCEDVAEEAALAPLR